jgi:alpha-beta hydrolase superfamily lysophospholipase
VSKFEAPTIIIVGHSMGGAIAAKATEELLKSQYVDRV